jgi:fatty acid desaturase
LARHSVDEPTLDHELPDPAFAGYRANVLASLERGGWPEPLEQASRQALRLLKEQREQKKLTPSLGSATLAGLKAAFFSVVPLLLADHLMRAGRVWAALPLVLVAGMAVYGAVAIVHDLAHGSFLPSRRANALLGRILAPLVLLDFTSFRRSHLEHHRTSQSVADPKRFGAAHDSAANAPDYRTFDHIPWFFGKLVELGASVADLPVGLRQFLYLCVSPIFFGPAVFFGSGEFALLRRNWRRLGCWLGLAESAALVLAMHRYSPLLPALAFAALLIGFSFVFFVFTTHLSPNQVYWTDARRATLADALNVSDVRCGALLRYLGHGFADHHSTHHLSPAIPCYRLLTADALIAPGLAPFRAPPIDLLRASSCAFLYDNFFRAIVLTNAEAWDYTPIGALRSLRPERAGEGPPKARLAEGRQ